MDLSLDLGLDVTWFYPGPNELTYGPQRSQISSPPNQCRLLCGFFDAQQGCKDATLVKSNPNLDGPEQK